VAEVAGALERHRESGARDVTLVELLRMRATLSLGRHDAGAAVDDLEEAFAVTRELHDAALGAEVEAALTAALLEARDAAVSSDDEASRRATTLRLVELYAPRDVSAAREELSAWVEHDPTDREALLRLRDMDVAAERWDGVAHDCARSARRDRGPGAGGRRAAAGRLVGARKRVRTTPRRASSTCAACSPACLP
jgi:hypothetical protein